MGVLDQMRPQSSRLVRQLRQEPAFWPGRELERRCELARANASKTQSGWGLFAAVHESAFGTKRTFQCAHLMSAFASKADITV